MAVRRRNGLATRDAFERLVEDAPLEGFDVNDDVGKFRHGSAILSWGFATVNPFVAHVARRAARLYNRGSLRGR